jgi:hypothetical protein
MKFLIYLWFGLCSPLTPSTPTLKQSTEDTITLLAGASRRRACLTSVPTRCILLGQAKTMSEPVIGQLSGASTINVEFSLNPPLYPGEAGNHTGTCTIVSLIYCSPYILLSFKLLILHNVNNNKISTTGCHQTTNRYLASGKRRPRIQTSEGV